MLNALKDPSSSSDDLRHYELDDRLTARNVMISGTDTLVRLALEQACLDRAEGRKTAGFISGYRGSPLAGYDLALQRAGGLLADHGIRFKPAINEDLAATALIGTQEIACRADRKVDGVFGIWYGKGPGVDRSGDALKHGNALGASREGGVLALLGDDHGCVSSSMPHQSDQALQHYLMPVLHPARIEDYIPFGLYGIALSRFSGAWVGMKAISEIVESKATIRVERPSPTITPYFDPSGLHHDPASSFGPPLEAKMVRRLDAIRAFAAANPIDQPALGAKQPQQAIIAVGKAFDDLTACLFELGYDEARLCAERIGVYKVGLVWPIDPKGFEAYLKDAERVLVVEEKRAVVEWQLKEHFFGKTNRFELWGKKKPDGQTFLPETGELQPSSLSPQVSAFLRHHPANLWTAPPMPAGAALQVTKRTPYFCSGCPHSRSTKLPEGSEAMPGIGCHFMASWMDRDTNGLIQMGGEGVNWIGQAPFVSTAHVFQNLGDGTYFHSGLLAIRQAIAAKVNITYKILYNDAVAMTGGQSVDGRLTVEQIVTQLRGEGVRRIAILSEQPERFAKSIAKHHGVSVDARDRLIPTQEELRSLEGVSVLIYDQGCATEKRRKRKKGTLPAPTKRVVINSAVCEGCGDCSTQANCVSLRPVETDFGTKRRIDQSSCNMDYACTDGFCPSFVTVSGKRKKSPGDLDRRQAYLAKVTALTSPPAKDHADILITGVGGTGVVTIGAILAMAAHLEGKQATVLDFMGFAQKGGAVISHVKIASGGPPKPVRVDRQEADLLIACDLVVATMPEPLATLSRSRTAIIANSDIQPTGDFVRAGVADFQANLRLKRLGEASLRTQSLAAESLAEALFGNTILSNMLLLGQACQAGSLPVSVTAIQRAIEVNGVAVQANLDAFAIGRVLADAGAVDPGPETTSDEPLDDIITRQAAFLTGYQSAAFAQEFEQFIEIVRHTDMMLGKDALTRITAAQLARLMVIKDEYEVARLHLDYASDEIDKMYEPGVKVTYHLAPPWLTAFLKKPDGRPGKIAVPGWLARPAFKTLRALRPLRGRWFDPFGWSDERHEDHALITAYRRLIETLLADLNDNNYEKALHIAGLVDGVRGYGHVRQAALARYQEALSQALKDWPGDQDGEQDDPERYRLLERKQQAQAI